MTTLMQRIESTTLVSNVESTLTTGDLDYDGTTLEISDETGKDLFQVVVDSKGQRQFRFFKTDRDFRIPLELMEQIVQTAKEKVSKM